MVRAAFDEAVVCSFLTPAISLMFIRDYSILTNKDAKVVTFIEIMEATGNMQRSWEKVRHGNRWFDITIGQKAVEAKRFEFVHGWNKRFDSNFMYDNARG